MQNFLAAFLIAVLGGGVVAAVGTAAGVSAFQSASTNKGADKPPADLNTVQYADE